MKRLSNPKQHKCSNSKERGGGGAAPRRRQAVLRHQAVRVAGGCNPLWKNEQRQVRDDQRSMHENNELNYVSR